MGDPEIISEEPMCLVELKQEIAKIKKRDKEPSFRVSRIEEFLKVFSPISVKDKKERRPKKNFQYC